MKFGRICFFIILLIYTLCKNKEKQMPLEMNSFNKKLDPKGEFSGNPTPPFLGENFLKSKLLVQNDTTNAYDTKYEIHEINTEIVILKNKNDGQVTESVKFLLKKGKADSFIRKISLAGTSDRHYDFKLTSQDVQLTSAKVIRNCMEDPNHFTQPPYLCVIAYFKPIEATTDPMKVEIFYDYTSENILRTKEKPFTDQEHENIIQVMYDNQNSDSDINLNNLIIKIENPFNFNNLQVYPEKYLIKSSLKQNTILWNKVKIGSNSFSNFTVSIPIFKSDSKLTNDMHLQITSSSAIIILIWGLTAFIVIVFLSYIFVFGGLKRNDDKYFTLFDQEQNETMPKVAKVEENSQITIKEIR